MIKRKDSFFLLIVGFIFLGINLGRKQVEKAKKQVRNKEYKFKKLEEEMIRKNEFRNFKSAPISPINKENKSNEISIVRKLNQIFTFFR